MRIDYILAELVLHHNQFKLVTDELLDIKSVKLYSYESDAVTKIHNLVAH